MEKQKASVFVKIRDFVRQIPVGKVATYGQIAYLINGKWKLENGNSRIDARMVGWAMHGNKNPEIPCHRLVNKEGRIAVNYAFGGGEEQRKKLLLEGVAFVDETHVDLEKHLWSNPTSL